MATYLIPTDISGGTILVNEGDIFIFEAGLNTDVLFRSSTGLPLNFSIQFTETNTNNITVEVDDGMNADIAIPDDVVLSSLFLDARNGGETSLTIGNNVTLDEYQGSNTGVDTVVIGDNFTTLNDFRTNGGDDAITIGNNATAPNFDAGGGIDIVITDDPTITVSNAENIDVIGEGTTTYFIPTDFTGGTILVNEGDIFIFESGASANVNFVSSTGLPFEFEIRFTESNFNNFRVQVSDGMHPAISVADDVLLDTVFIDARNAGSTSLTIGDNVTLQEFQGSNNGVDTVEIGDNFTTLKNFRTNGGNDTIIIGQNATGPNFDAGGGIDTVITRDPGVTISNAENIIYPDGIVDGTGLDDTIGVGYSDAQTDVVDGEDGLNDTIVGYRGNDTIDGGDGNDTIYGDYTDPYVAPPDPAPTAEELAFVIEDADVSGGIVAIDVDTFSADVSQENYVLITDNTGLAITTIELAKMGKGDDQEDVFEFDLATFDDDFLITVKSDGIQDKIVLVGVETSTDNGDGTFSYTYVGDDGQVHTVTVSPNVSTILTFQAELDASVSSDVIDGGVGDDFIDGGFGDDQITGGIGADTISGGVGNDSISGGDDADVLSGGAGSDTVLGDAGDDTIFASAGTDAIAGGTGTDTYDALNSSSLVDETISVTVDQAGDGTISKTGDGTTDTFTSVENFVADEVAGQTDSITFFGPVESNLITGMNDTAVGLFTPLNGGDPIPFGGPGEPTLNQLLSGTYDPGTGVIKPFGLFEITSGEEDGAQIGNINFSFFEEVSFSTVCYGPGTLIDTPTGPRAVETLRPNDIVETLDGGPQRVLWVRHAEHALDAVQDNEKPILIRAGAFGDRQPFKDLVVSPQHRILVGGHGQLDQVFPEECFVAAKALTGLRRVRRMMGKRNIIWVHFALERHHIVRANGLLSESLLLGPMVLNGLTLSERSELEQIFGQRSFEGTPLNGPPARPIMGVRKAKRLMNAKNIGGSNESLAGLTGKACKAFDQVS